MKTQHQTSSEIAKAQIEAERKHHEERIAWLTDPNPKYACGTPVNKHDVASMLQASRECLADKTGMIGFNSSHESSDRIPVWKTLPDAMRGQGWIKGGTTTDMTMLREIKRDYISGGKAAVAFSWGALDEVHYWFKNKIKTA